MQNFIHNNLINDDIDATNLKITESEATTLMSNLGDRSGKPRFNSRNVSEFLTNYKTGEMTSTIESLNLA